MINAYEFDSVLRPKVNRRAQWTETIICVPCQCILYNDFILEWKGTIIWDVRLVGFGNYGLL